MKKFAYLLAAAAVFFGGTRARADLLVQDISGVNLSYQMSVSGSLATLNLSGVNLVTVINGTPGYTINTLFASLSFDRAGTVTAAGTVYNFDPSVYPNGETIQYADGNAVLTLTGLAILVPTGFPHDMVLSGTLQLVSNASTAFNMSLFSNPASTFNFSINDATQDLNNFIATGGSGGKDGGGSPLVGTASFSEADPAPEPSSLVLLGLGSLGMIGYGWRRRRLALA